MLTASNGTLGIKEHFFMLAIFFCFVPFNRFVFKELFLKKNSKSLPNSPVYIWPLNVNNFNKTFIAVIQDFKPCIINHNFFI